MASSSAKKAAANTATSTTTTSSTSPSTLTVANNHWNRAIVACNGDPITVRVSSNNAITIGVNNNNRRHRSSVLPSPPVKPVPPRFAVSIYLVHNNTRLDDLCFFFIIYY
jgi:uncharacterized protein (DUF2126 family)